MEIARAIESGLSNVGLTASEANVRQLGQYYELLRTWNRRVNLTALPLDGYPSASIDRLLVEPLVAAKLISDEPQHVLDLGSGGGSPGIPLKIVRPSLRLTMVEARLKKVNFLREAIRHLRLSDTEVVNDRIESMRLVPGYCASVVTVRALRVDPDLLDCLAGWIQPAAQLFLFGGPLPADQRLSLLESIELPGKGHPLTVWRWI